MQLQALLNGVQAIKIHAPLDLELDAICYDSRKAKPGTAFIAARRTGSDGHDYIPAAVGAGASVIVAERAVEGCPCVVVPDGAQALARISANFYGNPADKMRIVGITGTKGKSTTAFNLKHILESALGVKTGLVGTVSYMAGDEILAPSKNSTPEAPELHALFAQMYTRGCGCVVMEVSSHALDVGRVAGIDYASAIFTNLSQDHLDYHKTMENYLAAKAKLFSMTPIAAINADDAASRYLLDNTPCRKALFGLDSPEADFRAENLNFFSDLGARFDAVHGEERHTVALTAPGRFMVYNALAAIACACTLGVDFAAACEAMCHAPAVPGRLEHVDEGQDFRVIVDYAHSPESVKQICRTAREFTRGKLIVLLGCGGNRDRTKRPIMGNTAAQYADLVVVTTDNPRFEEPQAIIDDILPGLSDAACPYVSIVDRREAIGYAISAAKTGDTVLLLGKGHETYQEVCGVRSHFSDAEEARTVLRERKA